MSKHMRVNGQLLQLDKTFNQLKSRQKEKIFRWMFEETKAFYQKHGRFPTQKEEFQIVFAVYARIEAANIWIPDSEIFERYHKKRESICKSVRREEVRNAHLLQRTAMITLCLVCKGNEVLVVEKRKRNRPILTFPGGDVLEQEAFGDAVVRNVFEQTRILIQNPVMKGIFHWQQEDIHHVCLLYLAGQFEGRLKETKATSNSSETSEDSGQIQAEKIFWITRSELEQKNLSSGIRQVLKMMESPAFSECYASLKDEEV